MPRKKATIDYEEGSGNIFADLGFPHPKQELLKARLTLEIYRIIKARHLTQAQAGEILGIKQPHVSLLMRNRPGDILCRAPDGLPDRAGSQRGKFGLHARVRPTGRCQWLWPPEQHRPMRQ